MTNVRKDCKVNKDVLLLNFSFVTYMASEDHLSEDCKYTRFAERANKLLSDLAAESGLEWECPISSLYVVGGGREPDNSGRCAVCNIWVSAHNREDPISDLAIGAVFDDQHYCMQHLPKQSPMYKVFFPVWERDEEE